MLENYLTPQLQQDMASGFIFQQDGMPLHFHCKVITYLSHKVIVWIG
jgi:hypothetical protein